MICVVSCAGGCVEYRIRKGDTYGYIIETWAATGEDGTLVHQEDKSCNLFATAWLTLGNLVKPTK